MICAGEFIPDRIVCSYRLYDAFDLRKELRPHLFNYILGGLSVDPTTGAFRSAIDSASFKLNFFGGPSPVFKGEVIGLVLAGVGERR